MKGFSASYFMVGLIFIVFGLVVVGSLQSIITGAGMSTGSFEYLLLPIFPFIVGLGALIFSFKKSD